MAQIIMLVGPPGSGKSTQAKQYLETHGNRADLVRISQDDQGKEGHMQAFEQAIVNRHDIVVDRMNFDKNQRNRYLDPARKAGYATRIIVCHAPLSVCLERCAKRENHPTIKDSQTASKAVNFFFKSYERVSDDEADEVFRTGWVDVSAPKIIICDLDGTLCNVEHRRHFVRPADGSKKNWKAFFDGIPHDTVNEWCRDMLERFNLSYKVILCSGRDDSQRKMTTDWLNKHHIPYSALYMRGRNDSRRDDIVKEIILDFEILPRYNVYFTIDDRQQVVDMWRRRGLVCLQCDPGDF